MSSGGSHWCYRCRRFVRIWSPDSVFCPDCGGGFLEEITSPPSRPIDIPTSRRPRRASAERSPFNPVIVLRGPMDGRHPASSSFGLYYDDANGSGLRPLPAGMSDFLMGSGFDRLLDQLAQVEANGPAARFFCDHPPASEAAIESMPTVEIEEHHVGLDVRCPVCQEPFECGSEAREMPCKHIYHKDCILPWLLLRNSCPVCRHELPTDVAVAGNGDGREPDAAEHRPRAVGDVDEETVGLTIWRLPGGGFAVGRFSGGRRAAERELPVVYTEMDGGFNGSGSPRRISWTSRGRRPGRSGGGFGRSVRNLLSIFCFRRASPASRVGSEVGGSLNRSHSESIFSIRSSRRHSGSWALDDGNVDANANHRW